MQLLKKQKKAQVIFFTLITLVAFSCKKDHCDLREVIYSTVSDIDNNTYPTVFINNQEWMTENLNVGRFANGDTIIELQSDSAWISTNANGYAYYNNNSARQESFSYGKLYNFNAVTDGRNICPTGWHVSTKSDWDELVKCMGGAYEAGFKLKENSSSAWSAPNNAIANDTINFSALPQGARIETGEFQNQRFSAYFWNADDQPAVIAMSYLSEGTADFEVKEQFGASVRCVKD